MSAAVVVVVVAAALGVVAFGRLARTGRVDLTAAAGAPLRRVRDEIIEIAGVEREPVTVHVRVWRGWVGLRYRRVVVLGDLGRGHDPHLWGGRVPAWLDRHILDGTGRFAVWIAILPPGRSSEPQFINETFRPWRHDPDGGWPRARSVYLHDVGELDRLVGAPVEQFLREHYTREVVEQWQRTGEPVAVIDDSMSLRRGADALEVLHHQRGTWPREALLAARTVAALVRRSDDFTSRLAVLDGIPTRSTDADDAAASGLDSVHLAVSSTRARLRDTDHELLASYPEVAAQDCDPVAALDVLLPWEQRLRHAHLDGEGDTALVDAVKIAVDGLEESVREQLRESTPVPGTMTVWQYKFWWVARREDLPWLTDPDDCPDPRYTSVEVDWHQVAAAVDAIATQLDREDLVSHRGNGIVVVDYDSSHLGEREHLIVHSWFNSGIAPSTDPWLDSLVDGRHRLWGIWAADPTARVPVKSTTLMGAAESGFVPSLRIHTEMTAALSRLETSVGANRRYARHLDWVVRGRPIGRDHRGGPCEND